VSAAPAHRLKKGEIAVFGPAAGVLDNLVVPQLSRSDTEESSPA
jgi:hypothetical protein